MEIRSTTAKTVLALGIIIIPLLSVAQTVDDPVMQRLDRIERLLQSQGLLDMLQQIESLQRELNVLQGQIELQNHTLEQIRKRQRDLYTDLDQRLQNLERGGPVAGGDVLTDDINLVEVPADEAPPLQTIEPVGDTLATDRAMEQADTTFVVEMLENDMPQQDSTASSSAPGSATPEQAGMSPGETVGTTIPGTTEPLDPVQIRAQYQQAFKLLKRSQYDQAIKAFAEFLQLNPQSEYSDNAQYWLAEAYYVKRQFEQALVEYNKLLSNYPDSKKYTHSLLKIGFCYHEMNELDQAINRLQHLVQKYPDTTAARLADERLKKIARQQAQTAEQQEE